MTRSLITAAALGLSLSGLMGSAAPNYSFKEPPISAAERKKKAERKAQRKAQRNARKANRGA